MGLAGSWPKLERVEPEPLATLLRRYGTLIGFAAILVLSRGETIAQFSREEFDREKILRAALAGHDRLEADS